MADKSKAWEKLIDDAKKVPEKILGNVTAAIFIFGPSVNGRGKGTKIRKLLKEKINKEPIKEINQTNDKNNNDSKKEKINEEESTQALDIDSDLGL